MGVTAVTKLGFYLAAMPASHQKLHIFADASRPPHYWDVRACHPQTAPGSGRRALSADVRSTCRERGRPLQRPSATLIEHISL
jgi:hypothetical protein